MKLGKEQFEWYPEEMQVTLRQLATEVERGDKSKTTEYDMTDGWLYHIRLFDEGEKDQWKEQLKKIKGDDTWEAVGAQWYANLATQEPPAVFQKGVRYRPVLIKDQTP